ncbi:ribonuclease catalytic domain-containing protein [Pseudofrancisella aestuarii]|uniref:Ribonuclease catalytic domain-containing protein n=1 Tax=Pseudofrancisella aestuarii TaxID=2670347 RepID=A0ABV9TCP4_9GAMM|nr:RNB domain-containing ribonuclease [Pseudofrancisella aestuarii]
MQINSLVIFKSKPAKVLKTLDKKVEIETLDGKNIKLPPKNVDLLIQSEKDFSLQDLKQLEVSELETTWELLQGQEHTSIEELGELLFDKLSIDEAYTVWLLVSEGEYFSFNEDLSINIHSEEKKKKIIAEKLEKQKKEQEINSFLERLNNKTYLPEDEKFIKEIVNLATLKSTTCRFFKNISMEENESNAYKLLLEIGYWNEYNNPYLQRYGAELKDNPAEIEFNDSIDRVDLTHLQAYAIDDEDSHDPDDAISWDGHNNKMWVHVADPTSIIDFNSSADLEARARGSNLYVPEAIVSMLPKRATDNLGLGLTEISPALSIGFKVDENGDINSIEICFSNIRVSRLSYEYAEANLNALDLGEILLYAEKFTKKRLGNGAVELDFPEVKIKLEEGNIVKISDLPRLGSRILVRDTMLMAGVAVGQFCLKHNIPVPFSTQAEHSLTEEEINNLDTLSNMFSTRKKLQRGQYSVLAARHAGMGLENYVQVTSPLRRYLDLLVHYQLRRHLNHLELISSEEVSQLIAEVGIPIKANRQTERASNLHWKLVFLMQNENWSGEATVVEKIQKGKVFVSINKLAMMKKLVVSDSYKEDDKIFLQNTSVNLVVQEAFFKVLETIN